MIYLISYDLKQPGRNYDDLYSVIKSADDWAHAMDSLWFINTTESVKVWSNRLRQVLDENDWILVVDITSQPRQGWMKKVIWDWLNKQVQRSAYTY